MQYQKTTNNRITSKDGLTFIKSELLAATTHAFLGRTGGVSKPPYASLNTGLHVHDNLGNIAENRSRVRNCFSIENKNLVIVTQVHGAKVIDIKTNLPPETTRADAIITNRPSIAIAVQTADCVPILFFDPNKKIIGVAHAGWRGTLSKIAEQTIAAMIKNYESEPADIRAAIGPAIGPCCYEVSAELVGDFRDKLGYELKDITGATGEARGLDLPSINKLQLEAAGVVPSNIDQAGICTSCRKDLFFSHRGEADAAADIQTGRQLSLIMITENLGGY